MVAVGGGEAGGVRCHLSATLMSVSRLPVAVNSPGNLLPGRGSGGLDFVHGRGEISARLADAGSDDACGCRFLLGALPWS